MIDDRPHFLIVALVAIIILSSLLALGLWLLFNDRTIQSQALVSQE